MQLLLPLLLDATVVTTAALPDATTNVAVAVA